MAEVCVAIAIVGLATTYIFSSLQDSIRQYARLRDEICCNELADEHLARSVAQFLTNPPDFDTATAEKAPPTSIDAGPYTISLQTTCEQEDRKKEPSSTMEKEPVALMEFLIVVQREGENQKFACRSALLCVSKEGSWNDIALPSPKLSSLHRSPF
jgi:type II secretory pathway pseudopilin PulG